MEKTKKYLVGIAIIIVMFFSFVLGSISSSGKTMPLVNELKAEPMNLELPNGNMTTARSCSYEVVYCYGHNFLVFYSGNDIEVIVLN